MKLVKYRIVTDKFSGFESQIWRWYWPFWTQIFFINSSSSIEKSTDLIEKHKKGPFKGEVVLTNI